MIESRVCDAGQISVGTWDLVLGGIPLMTTTYTTSRTDLLAEGDLIASNSWTYAYVATDTLGYNELTASGTFTVVGPVSVSTSAGTFSAIQVENDYSMTDTGGYLNRDGLSTSWYVRGLGLVKTVDEADDGSPVESRDLVTYSGFYP